MEQHNINSVHQACAACKHQRKRCNEDCTLARYFPAKSNQEFQAVHKVFGVANVSKLVKSVKEEDRNKTAQSLVWEAMCRQRDPVLGSYGVYKQLEHKLQLVTNHYLRAHQEIQAMQVVSRRTPPSLVGYDNGSNKMDDRAVANYGVIDNNVLSYFDDKGNSMVNRSPFGYPCHPQTQQIWKQERDDDVIISPHSINGFKEEKFCNPGNLPFF